MNDSDDHDQPEPWIEDRVHALEAVPAPDVWSAAIERAGLDQQPRTQPRQRRHRRRAVAVAALLLAVGLAFAAIFGQSGGTIIAAKGGGDAAENSSQPATAADDCSDQLVSAMLAGSNRGAVGRSATVAPARLALSSRMIRGSITGAVATPTGSHLLFELDRAAALDGSETGKRATLWTPGFPAGDVQGRFVAFLNPGATVEATTDGLTALATIPGGLWVACDDESPARSLRSTASDRIWADELGGGLSLTTLWQLDAEARRGFEHDIAAVGQINQANVFDVELHTGERFRLAVPTDSGGELRVIERRAPDPITLSNEFVTMVLRFERCPDGDRVTPSAGTGAALQLRETGLIVCRASEGLHLDVALTEPLPDRARLQWDVLTMSFGSRLNPDRIDELWAQARCDDCRTRGPMIFGDEPSHVVVAQRKSRTIEGYAADDLTYIWGVEFRDGAVIPHAFSTLVIAEVRSGPVVALDARTGTERWRIATRDERDLRIHDHGDGITLIETSKGALGQPSRPVMRRIDSSTGEILWEVSGRQHREWGASKPVLMQDVVVTFDQAVADAASAEDTFAGSPTIHGFDVETGEQLWSLTLDGRGNPNQYQGSLDWIEVEEGRILLFRSDRGELVRIDATDGSFLWRVTVGDVAIGGTAFAPDGTLAIDLANSVLLSPETGELLSLAMPPDCEVLLGPLPWITLFDDREAGCVIAGDHQRLRVFNKGRQATTVSWLDGERELASDEFFDTDPVGDVLRPGLNEFSSTPFVIDDIWRMPVEISPTARYRTGESQLGPITTGMTLEQAELAIDSPITIDDDRFGCRLAYITGDPYSPLFKITAGEPLTATIETIAATDGLTTPFDLEAICG